MRFNDGLFVRAAALHSELSDFSSSLLQENRGLKALRRRNDARLKFATIGDLRGTWDFGRTLGTFEQLERFGKLMAEICDGYH